MTSPRLQGAPALCLDIGGTKIKGGLIKPTGDLHQLIREGTPAREEPKVVAERIIAIAGEVCNAYGISPSELAGVGVSIAGFITADGLITATAHLSPEWVGFDLGAPLRDQFGVDCYFALDTPAPTLGEAYYGAGRDVSNFVYVTVSTGIGAGIVIDGEYFTGGLGWAGGVGHTILDETSERICEGCGNAGCLETFAATQGILATAHDLLSVSPESRILDLADNQPSRITPELIYRAALDGDDVARSVWSEVGHKLGVGLVNLVDIVAPERVIIGGGVAQAGDLLLRPAREVIENMAFPPQLRSVELVQAELGDLSGIYGAAAMVFNDIRINLPEEMK